jgi:hypothetical protein
LDGPVHKHIRPDSWHARWYRLWLELGGKKPAYKENLCRYVRILLFWAPLRWFFLGRFVWLLTPAVVVSSIGLVYVSVWVFTTWTSVSLRILEEAGILLGIIFALIAIIAILIALHDRYPQGLVMTLKWATSPIWIAPYLAGRGLRWVGHTAERPVETFIGWFFYRFYFRVLNPSLLLALAGVTLLSIYEPHVVLKVLEMAGIVIAAALAGLLALVLFMWIKDQDDFFKGVRETLKLGEEYVQTKKQGSRICPFLEFEAES